MTAATAREFRDRSEAGRLLNGLDLYSLHASMAAVVEYLERLDPDAAQRARERYACFDQFGRDPQVYACEAGIAGAEPCEQQAVAAGDAPWGRNGTLGDSIRVTGNAPSQVAASASNSW